MITWIEKIHATGLPFCFCILIMTQKAGKGVNWAWIVLRWAWIAEKGRNTEEYCIKNISFLKNSQKNYNTMKLYIYINCLMYRKTWKSNITRVSGKQENWRKPERRWKVLVKDTIFCYNRSCCLNAYVFLWKENSGFL